MTTAPESAGRDKCGGRKRDGSGNTCTRPAGWGTDHPGIGSCKLHGGSTPNHKTAARVEQARRDVATYGLPIDVEPGLALLQEVHRTAGHVAWLGAKVAELDEADLVWGVTEEVDKGSGEFTGTDTTRAAKPNAWLVLYQQERKHLVDVSAATVKAGVDKAIVRLTEQQGSLLAGAISRILDALELSPSQRSRVPEIVPGVLLDIAGEAGGQ
jgi:hypothetical protein